MIGCVVWLMCVCWLTVSSSLGLREINPRQSPHCLYRLTGFTPRQRPSRSTTNKQPTHTHSTNHASIHPPSHPSVHSPTYTYTHPFNHSSIHPPVQTLIYPPVRTTLHQSIHHPSVHPNATVCHASESIPSLQSEES